MTVAACAAGPLALAVLHPRSQRARRRPLRAADVGLHRRPRASLRRPRAPARAAAHPLPDRRRPRDRRRPPAQRPPAARPRAAAAASAPSTASSPGPTGSGSSSPTWRWPGSCVRHHERFPRAARQMAAVFDLGCVVYFAVPTAPPWWASEQGLTGEEVRRIMVEVGEPTWGRPGERCTTRSAATPGRRCPRCTSPPRCMAALSLCRSGQGRGRGRLGLRRHARLRPRLPRRALRHRPARRRGAGRRGAARRAAGRTRSYSGVNEGLQRLERIAERVASRGVSPERLGERRTAHRRDCRSSRRGGWSRRVVVVCVLLGRDLLPLPEAGRPRRRARQARRRRPALDRDRDRLQRRSPTRPTSPSSRRWSAATRCA